MVVTRSKRASLLPTEEDSMRMPVLENGDRLTRAEFERRYAAMSRVKRAELIEGVVHMPTQVKVSHGGPHAQLVTWLGVYSASTPGVQLNDNTTVRLDADNEVQPDALLRLERGGRSSISGDGYVEGAPELVAEIAASSASIDLHSKMNVYRRSSVQEYLVWQTFESRLDWFELHEEAFVPLAVDDEGVFRSNVFPGLWLDARALLEGDLASVLKKLQKGLETSEHRELVRKLDNLSTSSGSK